MRNIKKPSIVAAMALAMGLATAVPALAETGIVTSPGDLGLESINVTSTALDAKTKQVLVSGTVTCSSPISVFVDGFVRQDVGRFNTVEGFGASQVLCDGETPFSFAVSPLAGRFGGGGATVFAGAFAENGGDFDFAEAGPVEAKLKPSR